MLLYVHVLQVSMRCHDRGLLRRRDVEKVNMDRPVESNSSPTCMAAWTASSVIESKWPAVMPMRRVRMYCNCSPSPAHLDVEGAPPSAAAAAAAAAGAGAVVTQPRRPGVASVQLFTGTVYFCIYMLSY